ncbi:hypothetical protein [Mucilaginibacter sp. UYCu711]|uniref:hypothetical protein n=1 Tax=Mucilaginibacter sp. UYCu711 TaxID=3156339 RepID=UPI003D1A503F
MKNSRSLSTQVDTSSGIFIDTVYGSWDSIKLKKIKYYLTPPPITPLPFGLKVNLKNFVTATEFFANLQSGRGNVINSNSNFFREVKIYKLPPVQKVNFISVDQPNPTKCQDGQMFSNLLKFDLYQYRLPDINKYQVYYFTDFNNEQLYPSNVRKNCIVHLNEFYAGYLIFYDPFTKEANVIRIYSDAYVDGMALHTFFYIDKSQTITLSNFSAPSDDQGDDPDHPYKGYDTIVRVTSTGEIVLKQMSN